MEPTEEELQPTVTAEVAPNVEAPVLSDDPLFPETNTSEVEEPYDLDLDLIQPQVRTVKLNKKVYQVYPPKVKDIANLARLAGQLQKSDGNVEFKVAEMVKAFTVVMPALADEDVDLSFEQVTALFQFINSMVSPSQNSALKNYGIEPTAQKKIQADS